jgi:hypothetical protein
MATASAPVWALEIMNGAAKLVHHGRVVQQVQHDHKADLFHCGHGRCEYFFNPIIHNRAVLIRYGSLPVKRFSEYLGKELNLREGTALVENAAQFLLQFDSIPNAGKLAGFSTVDGLQKEAADHGVPVASPVHVADRVLSFHWLVLIASHIDLCPVLAEDNSDVGSPLIPVVERAFELSAWKRGDGR